MDVVGGDEARLDRSPQLHGTGGRLGDGRDPGLDHEKGIADRLAVDLTCARRVVPDRVHMRARGQPVATQHGRLGMGGGADDVGGADGVLDGVHRLAGDPRIEELVREVGDAASVEPGDLHDLDAIEPAQRPGVASGLDARPDHGDHRCTWASQQPGGKRGAGRRTGRSDVGAVHEGDRRPGVGVEADDDGLVRRAIPVLGEQADELGGERAG